MPSTCVNYIVIISVIKTVKDANNSCRDNGNNRWKRNGKKQIKKKRQKGARGTEPIAKGWELNDFVVHLS